MASTAGFSYYVFPIITTRVPINLMINLISVCRKINKYYLNDWRVYMYRPVLFSLFFLG